MIFVLLIVFIYHLIIHKQIKNNVILYLFLSIWAFLAVTIISSKPLSDKSHQCITKSYELIPIQNNLDNSETNIICQNDSIIFYKTNKFKIKSIPDSLSIVLQDSSYCNTVVETINTHSICWRILTFDYSYKIVNANFYLKN